MAKVCLNTPLVCQYSFLHCLFHSSLMLKGINIKDLHTIQHSHLDHCEGGKWYYLQTMTIQAVEFNSSAILLRRFLFVWHSA
jgi:hypothetical protein